MEWNDLPQFFQSDLSLDQAYQEVDSVLTIKKAVMQSTSQGLTQVLELRLSRRELVFEYADDGHTAVVFA